MFTDRSQPVRQSLVRLLDTVRSGCTGCGSCVGECAFLRRHGSPKAIADNFVTSDKDSLAISFRCSLCGLCGAFCQAGLNPRELFLEMRREAVDRGDGDFPGHASLLNYERLGTSRRFTLYRLPPGCTTVFFPGCALPGSRPVAVSRVFELLRQSTPSLGIVLDCCMMPSNSLGRERHAQARFAELRDYLAGHGVSRVLTACPNCREMFDTWGEGLEVITVYELLAELALPLEQASGTVSVHDPCVMRGDLRAQRAVRTLLQRQGLTLDEMAHSGRHTLCCGQGGAVKKLDPVLAGEWTGRRCREAAGMRLACYCAGCVQALDRHNPASHLLDLLFEPRKALTGRKRGASAPFSWLNRLRLKRALLRMKGFAVTYERVSAVLREEKAGRFRRLVSRLLSEGLKVFRPRRER